MEQDTENIDSLNDDTENTNSPTGEGEATEEGQEIDYKARAEALEAKNAQLYARLKKDGAKKEGTVTKEKSAPENTLTREEMILIAKGFSEEDLDDVNFIADRYGKSRAEAATSRQFLSMQEARNKEKEAQASSMRSSTGSKVVPVKTFQTATSRDDHKALFEKEYK